MRWKLEKIYIKRWIYMILKLCVETRMNSRFLFLKHISFCICVIINLTYNILICQITEQSLINKFNTKIHCELSMSHQNHIQIELILLCWNFYVWNISNRTRKLIYLRGITHILIRWVSIFPESCCLYGYQRSTSHGKVFD